MSTLRPQSISRSSQTELREQSEAQAAARERQRAPATMDRLREKFLQTALSYCGAPYARKYHPPECECCGRYGGAARVTQFPPHGQPPHTRRLSSWTAVDWSEELSET